MGDKNIISFTIPLFLLEKMRDSENDPCQFVINQYKASTTKL